MESASHITLDSSKLKGMTAAMRDAMARLLSGAASKNLRLTIGRPASSGFTLHDHVYWEINVIGPKNILAIDEIQIIPPGVRHAAWQCVSQQNAFCFNISLDNVRIAAMPQAFKSPTLRPLTYAILLHLTALLKLADAMGEAAAPLLDAHAPALASDLAALFVACFRLSQTTTPMRKEKSTPSLPVILTEYHLAEHLFSISDMAARLGVSTKHVSNVFRRECGMSAKRYIIVRRLRRACDLLAENKLAISEVAHLTGWANAHYFATAFRKFTGMTPSEYSRKPHGHTVDYPPTLQIYFKHGI